MSASMPVLSRLSVLLALAASGCATGSSEASATAASNQGWIAVDILEEEPSKELEQYVKGAFARARFVVFWHRPPRSTGPMIRRDALEGAWTYQLTYRCPFHCDYSMQALPEHLMSGLKHSAECPPPFSTRMALLDSDKLRIAEFDFQSSGHCFVTSIGAFFTESSIYDFIGYGPALPDFLR